MTICVSVKVGEGLVFAADSAVMLQQTGIDPNGQVITGIIQAFNSANKVMQIKDYPIGVMSWGQGSIAERSIQSLIMEYEYGLDSNSVNNRYQVRDIAQGLIDFIGNRYNAFYASLPQQIPPEHRVLGIMVGGFSYDKFFAEQYKFEFPISSGLEILRPDHPNGTPNFGSDWYGLTDALVRLVKGFDLGALEQLISRGVPANLVQDWINDSVGELPLVFQGMPLQDAIDFAEYCVQVVIGRHRFAANPVKLCGGAIDIAVMRPKSFRWAQRKQWSIKD